VPREPAVQVPPTLTPIKTLVRRKRRGGLAILLSALLCVGLPAVLSSVYFFWVASDQYVSEFKFSVRGADRSGGDALAAVGSSSNPGALLADTFVVTDFINRRQIIDEVSKDLNARAIYAAPHADFWARFSPRASSEEFADYWRRMVKAHLDMLTGIVTVTVKAFTPQDAQAIATAIVKRSDEMFGKMTERSRHDSLHFAEDEVDRAEKQVKDVRSALRDFREQEKIFDPNRTAQANSDLIGKLREDLSRMNAQLTTMSSYLSAGAPQVQTLKTSIRATQEQISKIERPAGELRATNSGEVAPATLSVYESLGADLQFAEKAHAAALDSLQKARLAADRRTTYLSLFVQPTLAQTALFPERGTSVLIVVLAAATFWLLGLLVVSSIRDHLL
jgi:capsular polysaccharide transport system permease protein